MPSDHARPVALTAVVFDIDGTLLDSAAGIVAGFRHALRSVGFTPPTDAVLRSDLGPPVGPYFTSLGLDDALLERAVAAYRSYYRAEGMHEAAAYPGIVDLLDTLRGTVLLGTATAKRTDTAEDILRAARPGRLLRGRQRHRRSANDQGRDDRPHPRTARPSRPVDGADGRRPAFRHRRRSGLRAVLGRRHLGLRHRAPNWSTAGADTLVDRPGALLDLVGRLSG